MSEQPQDLTPSMQKMMARMRAELDSLKARSHQRTQGRTQALPQL